MKRSYLRGIGMLALLGFVAAAAPGAASDLWLHVRVDEAEPAT